MRQELTLDDHHYVWDNDELVMHVSPEMVARWHAEGLPWILNGLRKDYLRNPNPRPEQAETSGEECSARPPAGPAKLALRLPRDLYDEVKRGAAERGISMNTFVALSIARALGKRH